MLYRFENHVLDTDRRELRRGGILLAVEPQVFDLLVFLVRNCDRMVSKEDLLASVWNGRIVSDATLASQINAARRAIADNGKGQRLIRTIFGKGIRFVGPVQAEPTAADAVDTLPASRLSVVVLPFTNFSDDRELDHLADGVTDDLTTYLAQLPDNSVTVRNKAFVLKVKSIDITTVGRSLGVRYVIEGSIRRANDRVRINVQLSDAEGGTHIWADRFDAEQANFSAIQDTIFAPIARTLRIRLLEAASYDIEREGLLETYAHDLVIYGWSIHVRATTSSILRQAHQAFERALELDPNSISAKVGLGFALCTKVANYWSTSVQLDLARAEVLLLAAIEHEPDHLRARSVPGLLRRLQNRLDNSLVELQKAIALDPYFAPSFWFLGTTLVLQGQPGTAIVEIQKGLRLAASGEAAPFAYTALALAHLLLNQVEQGVEYARKACADNPALYFTHMYLAAGLGLKGDIDGAKAELALAVKIRPEFNSISKWRTYCTWGNSQYWKLHCHTIALGLQRAGMRDE